jgi:hypothetical protein
MRRFAGPNKGLCFAGKLIFQGDGCRYPFVLNTSHHYHQIIYTAKIQFLKRNRRNGEQKWHFERVIVLDKESIFFADFQI